MSEKGFFDEYFWDIIFAFIFAVVAAVLLEIVARPFRKLYKKFLSEKIQNFIKKVKNRGEETLHEAVILKSINSKFDKEAPSRYIAGAIKRHNSLCQNK